MIGQQELLVRFEKLIEKNKFPKFCIITGPAGSGKKTIVEHIHKQFDDVVFSIHGTGVDDIRLMIASCNKLSSVKHLCLIPDADGMSVQARNALLKVTEEPPKNTYIIMTLEDINNTLETIKSRATVFKMYPYTVPELIEYAEWKRYKEIDIIKDVCETPGEIDKLCSHDVSEFYNFVNKTVDNIAVANGANVFKIANKLQLKDTPEGYDLSLFFKMFIRICVERWNSGKYDIEMSNNYMKAVTITSTYLKDLKIKGISKQGVVDLWILDIRKEWM